MQTYAAAAVCLVITSLSVDAVATENGRTAAVLGTEGMQIWNVPPPGFFLINYTNYYRASRINDKNGDRIKNNPNINIYADALRLGHFYDIDFLSKYISGRVGIFNQIFLPVIHTDVEVGGINDKDTSVADITVGALGIYWKNGGLNLGIQPLTVDFPTGSYKRKSIANVGLNYTTLEPTLLATYVSPNGLDIGARARFLYNFTNESATFSPINPNGSDYRSGSEFAIDFNVGYGITSALELGICGYYLQQLEDDKIYDDKDANHNLRRALDGNRSEVFALGPALGYDFGGPRVYLHWQHELYAENTTQGDSFWLRFALRL